MGLVIKNGRVIDPVRGVDGEHTLFVNDGFVAALDEAPGDFEPVREINASGLVVCPGLVDLRARLRSYAKVACWLRKCTPRCMLAFSDV